jgi:acetyl-CoA carboxylase carboxyl transferase subunit alpha
MDHISAMCGDSFLELFGDRNFKDDKAMIGGLGKIGGQSFMIVGQQKGYNTKTRQYRNFGMANPEGYRKALRLMKMAEKFGIPVLTLIDTPGAYPGLEAEERGQGEAIARNIFEIESARYCSYCWRGSLRRCARDWCWRSSVYDGKHMVFCYFARKL